VRCHDPGGARVKDALDETRIVIRDADDGVDPGRVGGPDELVDVAQVHGAVLRVDPYEVKTRVAGDLRDIRAGQLGRDTEDPLSRL
jgi:hypothetical protein